MNENVKHYSIISLIYMLFSFTPFIFAFNKAENIPDSKYQVAIIVLVISQIILTILNTSSNIFYEFESYCREIYSVDSFSCNPSSKKNSDLSMYLTAMLLYLIPFIASIYVLDLYRLQDSKGPGFIASIVNLLYILVIEIAHFIRLKKMFDYIEETYDEDALWNEAKQDMKKAVQELTVDNHALMLTPAAFKDTTFMNFKKIVKEKIEKIETYKKLSDDKKKIILIEATYETCVYLTKACAFKYVDIE